MRKTFVVLGLLALALLACADDAFGRGRRRGGCDSGGYYSGGRAYYGGQDAPYGLAFQPDSRPSFYYDPALQGSARLMVLVPNQDAEIWFDGAVTEQRGMQRVFVTPALQQDGTYMIKARWTEAGKPIEQERRIQVRGGQVQTVDFRVSPKRMPAPGETPKKDALPLPKSPPESPPIP
jgi:uncharacterized protein (TIGR03000 family)